MKERIKDSAEWYIRWVIQYWKGLFDFSFSRYFIIQMLPVVYGMLLVGIGSGILYLIAETFLAGEIGRGFFYLFFAGPMVFLVLASIIRATMEFYMVIFRIAEDVDELVGIRDTVDKLSGVREAVERMDMVTSRIPFWDMLVGRKRNANDESARREGAMPRSESGRKVRTRDGE